MKKIIALLLAVALVAAMSVSVFAATPWDGVYKETWFDGETYYVKSAYDRFVDKVDKFYDPSSALSDYASALGAAKTAVANRQKEFNKAIADLKDAIKTAQNAALAGAYAVATEQLEIDAAIAINEFLAQAQYDNWVNMYNFINDRL